MLSTFLLSRGNPEFINAMKLLGYDQINFDFSTKWKWNFYRNIINFDISLGITDAASLELNSEFKDIGQEILTLPEEPLLVYIASNPKLKRIELNLFDDSLKDKLLKNAADEQQIPHQCFKIYF